MSKFIDGITRAVTFVERNKAYKLNDIVERENVLRLLKDVSDEVLLDYNCYVEKEEIEFFDKYIGVLNEKVK